MTTAYSALVRCGMLGSRKFRDRLIDRTIQAIKDGDRRQVIKNLKYGSHPRRFSGMNKKEKPLVRLCLWMYRCGKTDGVVRILESMKEEQL